MATPKPPWVVDVASLQLIRRLQPIRRPYWTVFDTFQGDPGKSGW